MQLELTMNDTQMTKVVTIESEGITSYTGPTFVDFQLHFMCFSATPTSMRFQ